MSWRVRAVPGHGHPAIHNIPPFWACLVPSISTSYPLQLCLKASRDVPKVFNSRVGGSGEGISGPPTRRFNLRAMAFPFAPPYPCLLLFLNPQPYVFDKNLFNHRHLCNAPCGSPLWWRQQRGIECSHIGNTFIQAVGQSIAFPWTCSGNGLQSTLYS